MTPEELHKIAEQGGPTASCMSGWFFGETKRPQNATLGRNAFAGAVMYSPQRPTSTWQGAARVGAGSNQFREGMAALGGPLSPSLGLRLALRAESFDGTITNQAEPSQLLGGWSKLSANGMLVWNGAENSGTAELAVKVDVTEPMGMETMVYVTINGAEVCARVEPSAAAQPGQRHSTGWPPRRQRQWQW